MSERLPSEKPKRLSIVIPVYNEAKNIAPLLDALRGVLEKTGMGWEIIFVDDGSKDATADEVRQVRFIDGRVRLVEFSRNFGKEVATTAGIHAATGDCAVIMDGDLQHPPSVIPELLAKWREGYEVVIGVRRKSRSDTLTKRVGSKLFYRLLRGISEVNIVPGSTDFRLLDRVVIDEFNRLTERSRITRGLIDWLGFRGAFVPFRAHERANGQGRYTFFKLFELAIVSFISLSLLPLRVAGYVGAFIMIFSGILGLVVFIDRYLLPMGLSFSGPAILAVIILFLVGVILVSLGVLAFYIGIIYREAQNRPMYIVRKNREQ